MIGQYVTRTHRQHSTMVTSVPATVQKVLDLTKGCYLVWEVDSKHKIVTIRKIASGAMKDG